MLKLFLRLLPLCPVMLGSALLAATPDFNSLKRPLAFEPNRGQAPAQVLWTARGQGYQLFLTSSGATITMAEPVASAPGDVPLPVLASPAIRRAASLKGRMSTVEMNLVGSHSWNQIEASDATGAVSNYLLGMDRSHWHTGIPQ